MRLWARLVLVTALCALVASCSVIVNNKLKRKGPAPDGSIGRTCMTAADCDDGDICNGLEGCPMGVCTAAAMPAGDGSPCGSDPMTHNICLRAACVVSSCGDGFVDTTATPAEECEDGNRRDEDGCDNDCMFSCDMAEDCQDGNVCDGIERCGTDTGMPHVCQEAPRGPVNGTLCQTPMMTTGRCMDGVCIP